MTRAETVILIAGVLLIIGIGAAFAQAHGCHPWPVLRDHLAESYGEKPIGGGVISDRAVIQVLAAPDGRTFSIVTISRNGIACMTAAGFDWDPGKLPAEEEGI